MGEGPIIYTGNRRLRKLDINARVGSMCKYNAFQMESIIDVCQIDKEAID